MLTAPWGFSGTGIYTAFHLTTSEPVSAYDIFPYGGGQSAMTSATLLLPTSAWDTNYVAVTAYGPGPIDQPFIELVAQEDNTSITINPTATATFPLATAATGGPYGAPGQAARTRNPAPTMGWGSKRSNRPTVAAGTKT